MSTNGDLKKLKSSWTKYDAVQVINVIASKEIELYLQKTKSINIPTLKAVLGINQLTDPLPSYWIEIQKYPRQLKLFALLADIFTHYDNIKWFAESSMGKMRGIFHTEGKHGTNLRSALVESGASSREYRRETEVPYDFSILYENGEVGKLFKQLLIDRLISVGFDKEVLQSSKFYNICNNYELYKTLSLSKELFKKWLEGTNIDSLQIQSEYSFEQLKIFKELKVLKVNQWLNDWDDIDFNGSMRQKPDPYFFIFKIDARLLKRLSDVHRRKSDKPRIEDPHVQRKQNESRTEEIKKYIEGGFPWSTIKSEDQRSPENEHLKMPGILATSIIANILGENQIRGSKKIKKSDLILIENKDDENPTIVIPDKAFSDSWDPDVKPIEIIDGQHRLWAFDENEPISGNYELPVVAYYNLDRTWQAYLFYTINIKPVKINTSLGYDLYPLLRTQEWLENSKDGLLAYRENRSQEIVEVLWRYPESAWKNRINMLGESGGPTMSQAAFIRSLTNTFFKNRRGLFGDTLSKKDSQVVLWNRAQQASFIILLWDNIAEAVKNCTLKWCLKLREESENQNNLNAAFISKNSLLARDQGVRGTSMFANDFFYEAANSEEWDFNKFQWDEDIDETLINDENIDKALQMFREDHEFINLVKSFSLMVSQFDWRTTSAEFSTDEERNNQMRFKGSSGYSEIYKDLKNIFLSSGDKTLKNITLKLIS
jgi:hypothetical protein